jgi:HlyD family secretion protein
VPRELRAAVEWDRLQIALLEREAALEKARLELAALAETSEADIQILRSAEQKARRQLASAEATLAAVSVSAPRDGIFVIANHFRGDEDRKYAAGDTVFTGLTIATIPDLSEMDVAAELHDVDFGRVTAGMPARVVLDTYPDEVIPGKVEEVVAVANPTRFRSAFPVRVSLERVDPERMRPGMSVRVEVVRETWPDALVVPRGAVRLEGTEATVATAGSARSIRIARCTPTLCVVESGIEEGELVDVS